MTNPIINQDGNKRWYNDDGERHRIDGPAVEDADGTKHWWQNGLLHRIDGPAVECASGNKSWYQNGQRHRIDGPAIEWADGDKEWWQYNIEVNPNIKINHNICQSCKTKCHDEPKLVNIPIGCIYELEHVVSNHDQSNNR